MSETRFEKCVRRARNPGFCCTNEVEVIRVAKHLFAKELVGGATLGKANGKWIVDRAPQARPNLP